MTIDLQDLEAYKPKLRIVSDNRLKWFDGVAALAVSKQDGVEYIVMNNSLRAPAETVRIIVKSGFEVEGRQGYAINAEIIPRPGEMLGVEPSCYQNQFVVRGPEPFSIEHPEIAALDIHYTLGKARHSIAILTGAQSNRSGIVLCALEAIAGCSMQEAKDTAKGVLSAVMDALETTVNSLYLSDSIRCPDSTQPLSPYHQRLGAAEAVNSQN